VVVVVVMVGRYVYVVSFIVYFDTKKIRR